MRQPDLFAPVPARVVLTGPALRDQGHVKVAAVDPALTIWVKVHLDKLCARRTVVTSDDLWAQIEADCPADPRREQLERHPNLIGAAFRALACAGEIEDSGRAVKTTRVSGQGRKLTVWEVVGG